MFGISIHVVFHPSMDVNGPSIWVYFFWICSIVSTIDFFNCSSFSQSVTFFAFFGSLSSNTCSLVTLLLVVTLISTTFTSVMIVCISTINWTYATITTFPWNIFCISANFGQSVILCPFKPHICHAYEDVFCGFWLGYVTSMTNTMVCSFFLHVSTLWFIIPQFMQCLLVFHVLLCVLLVLYVWYCVVLIMHSLLL